MSPPDFYSVFLRGLNQAGVRYMVTGAVASTIYGEPRLTQDLDLVLTLSESTRDALLGAFPADQYYLPPRETLEHEAGRATGGHFKILHLETGLRADCYLVGENELNVWGLERRRPESIAGETIWIAPPEYVIAWKLEFRRQGGGERHVDDVARMLRVSHQLIDHDALQAWIVRMGLGRQWLEASDRLAKLRPEPPNP